jgi:hypothetical protein
MISFIVHVCMTYDRSTEYYITMVHTTTVVVVGYRRWHIVPGTTATSYGTRVHTHMLHKTLHSCIILY